MPLPESHPLSDGRTAQSRLVGAYSGQRQHPVPVWFTAQGGLAHRKYSEVPIGVDVLDACLRPELAAELTLGPLRHGVDAVEFFTDPAVALHLAGIELAVRPDIGARVARPVRSGSDAAALRPIEPGSLGPVTQGVRLAVAELGRVPLIAVAAAPFTLACLLIEGRATRDRARARSMMYSDANTWATVLNWCADVTGEFLLAQVLAGASAAQLADPAMGCLSEASYLRRVAPHSKRAYSALRGLDVAKVHFGLGNAGLVAALPATGADVAGIDWRIPLDFASDLLRGETPLQGNLDPALLDTPWRILDAHVRDVVERGKSAPAHVVGLGDGLPSRVSPEVLSRVADLVHELD